MRLGINPLIFILLFILLWVGAFGCGAGQMSSESVPVEEETGIRMTAEDFFRPELVSSEFTDEVDEDRYRAIGERLTELSPNRRSIYYVGRLRRVPAQARIQVNWYHESMPEPQLTADVYGSDTFSFISTFVPPKKKFVPGTYTVRVVVNDREVGMDTFTVTGQNPFAEGIKVTGIQFARKLNPRGVAVNPVRKFPAARQVFASFTLDRVLTSTEVQTRWYRAGAFFSETDIPVNGNGRYTADIESPGGLPSGTYAFEVVHNGAVLRDATFVVGKPSPGPDVDFVSLGDALDNDQMPRRDTHRFRSGIGVIYCGLRFVDLHPGSEITVHWVLVEKNGESIYYTVRTPVPGGGSGSMNATWAPGTIYAGNYKAVVYINDRRVMEKPFTVQ